MRGDLNLFKRGRGLSMVKGYQNAIERYCIISTEIEILKGYNPPPLPALEPGLTYPKATPTEL